MTKALQERMKYLDHVRGDTFTLDTRIYKDELPVNISGFTFKFTMKRSPKDADNAAVIQQTTTNGGITLTNAAQGELRVTVPAATTTTWNPGEHWADLQLTTAGGEVHTAQFYIITIVEDITRV